MLSKRPGKQDVVLEVDVLAQVLVQIFQFDVQCAEGIAGVLGRLVSASEPPHFRQRLARRIMLADQNFDRDAGGRAVELRVCGGAVQAGNTIVSSFMR
jgi:translation elongation factor EF-4